MSAPKPGDIVRGVYVREGEPNHDPECWNHTCDGIGCDRRLGIVQHAPTSPAGDDQ